MGEGPGVEEGGEQPVKHDEDAGVLGVVKYKSPVQFTIRIVLPALLFFQNLNTNILPIIKLSGSSHTKL